jgi:hypothetical protein
LEQAKYGRYLKQVEGEHVTPPPAQQLPYPKFTKTYYPDTVYKRNQDLVGNMHKSNTEPRRQDKKKIIPTLPTYGYVAKQQQRNPKQTTTTTKSKEVKMDPDHTTQKISSAEYVRRNYPRVEGDNPQLLTQPLFRKFNADGVNDYRQIIIDTDFVRQQEVIQVTVTIGHPEGWDWEASPLTIPTNQVREVLDKLCQANETKLDSLAADQRLNKGVLYHTMSDKYNAKLEIIIQSEVGPHGRERMVNIKRESHGQQQMVKIPWIQLPRFIEHLTSLMDKYELTPLDVRHS